MQWGCFQLVGKKFEVGVGRISVVAIIIIFGDKRNQFLHQGSLASEEQVVKGILNDVRWRASDILPA